jgi:hypothetical protein
VTFLSRNREKENKRDLSRLQRDGKIYESISSREPFVCLRREKKKRDSNFKDDGF